VAQLCPSPGRRHGNIAAHVLRKNATRWEEACVRVVKTWSAGVHVEQLQGGARDVDAESSGAM
jgi:hypothetical protein